MGNDLPPPLLTRLAMAFVCFIRVLFNPSFAAAILPMYRGEEPAQLPPARPEPQPVPVPEPAAKPAAAAKASPEREHASGLLVLSMLQREGRLLDFVQEDISPYSDAEVGAAARVVHEGCRKVMQQYLALEPVLRDGEGASVQIPSGFDAQRIRLTGNVSGAGPFKGSVKHHGWAATSVKLPSPPTTIDPRILAPAEVELP